MDFEVELDSWYGGPHLSSIRLQIAKRRQPSSLKLVRDRKMVGCTVVIEIVSVVLLCKILRRETTNHHTEPISEYIFEVRFLQI